ncbi:hypothetical protein AOQ84DRAFT_287772 [Glonium stellatum]|uniref:Uncharacterized protein n=1 Tax=Glonium stellatum TaxID=574774 RepID=A0A8E2F5Y6_9PEZI|nr:hypothetical protein AOQ84DRAFT_287772 [Glonium stellatum]
MEAKSEDPASTFKLPASLSHAENSEHARKSNGQGESRDRKAAYALTLQKACNTALRRVKNNSIVANCNWAAPLAAAPPAASTMAILLKTAEMKAAAGLEIESQEVKDDEGNVKGKLPSKYFHTNLQHCSDIGRFAFLDAQHCMNNIRATARGMIAEEGTIAYIIDLLEDPEGARYNLKPEIKALRDSAKKCLENSQAVASKFQYWHLVICHLKQTSLSKRGTASMSHPPYFYGTVRLTYLQTAIMEILDESTRQLGKLKGQIEPLVDFFKSILSDIHNNVEDNLEAFLRPIIQGITEGSNPEECEAIRISGRSKERMFTTALQMQGRFSAMVDISAAYITISTEYIRPAINRMESLSTVSDSEWDVRSTEFLQWCENSMNGIDEVARTTNANVQRNIDYHINALHRRAIEGAAMNEGS